jgi:anti-sigma B factor antagonist
LIGLKNMKLPTEIFGDTIVAHTPEELGSDGADMFERCLTSLERVKVIIDLNGTETIESAGLEALLNAQEALQALGGDLKVATTVDANRKILEITRLDQRLEVFDSVIDAVRSFS